MTQYVINIGAIPNDGTGDPLRTAFNETNLNFNQVFAAGPVLSNIRIANNTILTTTTNGNLILAPNGIGRIQANATIVPSVANVRDLGSATQRWSTVYTQYLDLSGVLTTGDLIVDGNLTVQGNTIQIGNIVTDTKTIQLANTASNASSANGAGITVGVNDNIATLLYNSTGNTWTTNIGISSVGNISAPYFVGNGSLLTGLAATYGNANVATFLANFGSNTISTTGNITSNGLVNVNRLRVNQTANAWSIAGNIISAPSGGSWNSDPEFLDEYITSAPDGYINIQSLYANSNVASQVHLEHGLAQIVVDNGSQYIWEFDDSGNLTVPGNIIPAANAVYSLGNSTNYWSNLWVANNTIYIGGVALGMTAGNVLTVNGNAVLTNGSNTAVSTTGNITAGNIGITGGSLAWANASIVQTSASDVSITGDGQVTVRSLDGTYQWTFESNGNLTAPGNVSATGNISGNYFVGNGSQLTGISAGANTGNVTFNDVNIIGDGNLRLQPDPANASAYLDIYLTAGPDIHIAGNGETVILGTDDFANVTVNVDGNASIQASNGTPHTWTFDTAGNLNLPGNTIAINYADGNLAFGTVTFNNEAVIGTGTSNTQSGLYLAPDPVSLTNDLYLRVRGNILDEPTHIHFDTGNNQYFSQFIGDDNKYIQLANTGNIVINTSDYAANTAQWMFGTDGNLTLPYGAVIRDTAGNAVAFGLNAGLTNQNNYAVAIGPAAGANAQGVAAVAIGSDAGQTSQGIQAIAIGTVAGANTQGLAAVAVGPGAGQTSQGQFAVAIGASAGDYTQGPDAVAIGYQAGQTSQGEIAVAIGHLAGNASQGNAAVAVGASAGANTQGVHAVAIGTDSGATTQGNRAVAIGYLAGSTAQGTAAVAIGYYAGELNQGNNSIIINATDTALQQTTANTFTVAPIRNDVANVAEILFYDTTSKEITYGNTISVAGNITGGNISTTGNITGADVVSANTFVSNAFNVVTAGNLSITSQYGLGFTGTILEDNGTLELIGSGGGGVVVGWDSTYGNGLGNIATVNFNEVGGEGILLRTGNRAATEYNWNFDSTGNLTLPGNVTGNTNGFAIGYRDIPQVSFTGNATIATADAGKHFYSTQSTDYILTIANNASQGFQTGAAITVINQGTGNITVAQGSGVTLYLAGNATSGNRTVATFGMATIMKVATDTWFINGTGVS